MPFAGDLEHLPIVDVIQLLHSTRKSGTLHLNSEKGESQLVFQDGYIVSANHIDNSIRIGQILLGMCAITAEQLNQALQKQKSAGVNRKPLIATLMECNQLKKEDAYNGLENLIEMTIVDILSWTSGTFKLSLDSSAISDEYRYFPETLKQDMLMNTQGILMDALRIFDEKMRDGSLKKGIFNSESLHSDTSVKSSPDSGSITADILGLGELDSLEKKVPDVYLGLKDYSFSKADFQTRESFSDIANKEQTRIYSYLNELSNNSNSNSHSRPESGPKIAVILFSQDEFIIRIISTICKYNGLPVFSTDSSIKLSELINQKSLDNTIKLIIFDAPQTAECLLNKENLLSVIQNQGDNSNMITTAQLAGPLDYEFSIKALLAGVDTILPRPSTKEQQIIFDKDAVDFLKIFQRFLSKLLN